MTVHEVNGAALHGAVAGEEGRGGVIASAGGGGLHSASEMMTMDMDPAEGHDDCLMSSADVPEALASFAALQDAGYVIRSRTLEKGESRY